MKKTEKRLDLYFIVGLIAGIGANLLAQWIYDVYLADKAEAKKKQLTGFRE